MLGAMFRTPKSLSGRQTFEIWTSWANLAEMGPMLGQFQTMFKHQFLVFRTPKWLSGRQTFQIWTFGANLAEMGPMLGYARCMLVPPPAYVKPILGYLRLCWARPNGTYVQQLPGQMEPMSRPNT